MDVGCGFGRHTVPLAKAGYDISGMDITPALLKEARKRAKDKGLKIRFKQGDMRELPYKDESFDGIICMWSVFHELSTKKDQLKALKEMKRVLKPGGMALIDLPIPKIMGKYKSFPRADFILKKVVGRNVYSYINGVEAMPLYVMNKKLMNELFKKLKPKKRLLEYKDFGGKERFIVTFWK